MPKFVATIVRTAVYRLAQEQYCEVEIESDDESAARAAAERLLDDDSLDEDSWLDGDSKVLGNDFLESTVKEVVPADG